MDLIRVWRLLACLFIFIALIAFFAAGQVSAEQVGAFTGKWTATGEWELLDSTEGREVYTYKLEGPVNLTDKNGQPATFWSECVGIWDSVTGGTAHCVWKESQSQDAAFIELSGQMVKEDAKVSGEFTGGTGQFEGLIGTLSFTWSSVFGDSSGRILSGYAKDLSGSYMVATLFGRQAELAKKQLKNPWERFSLELGTALYTSDSNVRLGFPGLALDIDVEELIGADSETNVFSLQTFWRFTRNRRHRIDFSYFRFRRKGSRSIGRDIEIGGITIPLGTTVKTQLDYDIFRGSYSYSIFQDDRIDLAVSAGLFVLPIRFKFEATGVVEESVAESITAPLPVVGFRADYAITPRIFFKNRVDFFYLEFNEFKGSLVDLFSLAEFRAFKHFGFGGGIGLSRLNIDAKEENVWPGIDFVGNIRIEGAGLLLYGKYYF